MKDKNDHSELDLDQLTTTYSGASSWDDGIEEGEDTPPDVSAVDESLYNPPEIEKEVGSESPNGSGKKPKSKTFKILLYSGGSLLIVILIAGVGMIYVLKGQQAQQVPPHVQNLAHSTLSSPARGSEKKEVNSLSLGAKPATAPSSLNLGPPSAPTSSAGVIPSVRRPAALSAPTPALAVPERAVPESAVPTSAGGLLAPSVVAPIAAPVVSSPAVTSLPTVTSANVGVIKSLKSRVAALKAKISHESVELRTRIAAPKVVYRYIYVHPKVVTPQIDWTVKAISGDKAIVHVPGVGDVGVQRGSTIKGVTIRSIGSNGVSTSKGFINK
jgi:cytoskeletal protein RodZ